ncbi:hypothetical protein C0J52_22834, partial [Blattella germanica]
LRVLIVFVIYRRNIYLAWKSTVIFPLPKSNYNQLSAITIKQTNNHSNHISHDYVKYAVSSTANKYVARDNNRSRYLKKLLLRNRILLGKPNSLSNVHKLLSEIFNDMSFPFTVLEAIHVLSKRKGSTPIDITNYIQKDYVESRLPRKLVNGVRRELKRAEEFGIVTKKWFRFIAMFTSNQLLELMAQIMGAFQERFNKAPARKQHFSIGKDVHLLLAVLKTGCGVEGRRHEKKHVLELLLR